MHDLVADGVYVAPQILISSKWGCAGISTFLLDLVAESVRITPQQLDRVHVFPQIGVQNVRISI